MCRTLTPDMLAARHLRLSKIILFISTIVLVLTLSHIHHKLCKHHRVGGSHSHSHEMQVGVEGASTDDNATPLTRLARKLDEDDEDRDAPISDNDDENFGSNDDDENFGSGDDEVVVVEEVPPQRDGKKKFKKSLSNSHSLSHVMKKHFRKHLTAPTCVASVSTLIVAIIGVAAGFSGRSCSARALIAAIFVSGVAHAIGIAQRSAKICRNPESADMCEHIHKLVGVMLLGSLLHHMVLLFLAARYFCLCRFVEAQSSNTYVPIQGVVCVEQAEQQMDEKQVA